VPPRLTYPVEPPKRSGLEDSSNRLSQNASPAVKLLIVNWKHPSDPDAGGAERYLARLAELWSSEGQVVTMLVPRPAASNSDGRRPFEIIGAGSRRSVFRDALRFLKQHGDRYDRVLESVSTRPFFTHRVVGDRAFALYHQMAIDVWNIEFPFPVGLVGRYLVEPHWVRGMRGARVIAVSRSTKDDLQRYGVNAIEVIPPGCDAVGKSPPHHQSSAGPRLLFMGRLVRQKRAPDAIEAFRFLQQTWPDATLDVIGDGYLLRSLEARRVANVAIHGFVSEEDKDRLLMDADLVLIPATREGWGITAIEAAAHGVPVVAYDVGGLRDSVADGKTGLLCRPDPVAMAQAASGLLGNAAGRRSMASAAVAWAAQFTWERAAREVMRVLAGA